MRFWLMQPRDFSDFADQLNLQQGLHCEALYRTATGRWYYSLYNEVKSWLENRFADVWKNTPGSSHERLSYCCYELQRTNFDMDFSKLGRNLESMRKQRVHADYTLDQPYRLIDMQASQLLFQDINTHLDKMKNKYP